MPSPATELDSGLDTGVYARPRAVAGVEDCYFYHAMDIPGHGFVPGEWDLRGHEYQYLGGVPLAGRRVLEMGAASGFLTTYMSQQGAHVVGYDLSEDHSWDVVPFDGLDHVAADERRRAHLRRINNGFWLNHSAHGIDARLVHGTVYAVPEAIGPVDIATFGSILLHLRDPFLAMQNALRLTRETAVVTEVYPAADLHLVQHLIGAPGPTGTDLFRLTEFGGPAMHFLPQHWDRAYSDTWWHLPPAIVLRFLGVHGFTRTEVTYHYAMAAGHRTLLYTVVAHRT